MTRLIRWLGARVQDRVAMALWDAQLIAEGTGAGPDEFYDAVKARGAYLGSQREARYTAWLALRFFFGKRA